MSILKNGIGLKGQKVHKQVKDQRSMKANKKLKCYQIMPKAFAISFLTALGQADLIAITKGMANALGFISIIL